MQSIQPAEQKRIVKEEIIATIESVCTGSPDTCCFGYCKFNLQCAKPYFTAKQLPTKNRKLKSLLKNAQKRLRQKNGSPPLGKTIQDQISEILGQSIFEHDLVKNHQKTINRIKSATSLSQINEILARRHYVKYGYYLKFGNPYLYRKFMGESGEITK